MRQVIRHLCRGGGAALPYHRGLLPLVHYRHRGKIRECLHNAKIFPIERLWLFVRHNPECATRLVCLPRQQHAIRHYRRFNAHQVKEALGDTKDLRPSTLQANTAGTRIHWKHAFKKRLYCPAVATQW
jgi:hypothetical protein